MLSSTRSPLMPGAMRSMHSVVTPASLSTFCTGAARASSSSPPSSSRASMDMPHAFSIMVRKRLTSQMVVAVQASSSVRLLSVMTMRSRTWRTSLRSSGSRRRSASISSFCSGRPCSTSMTRDVRCSSAVSHNTSSSRHVLAKLLNSSSTSVMTTPSTDSSAERPTWRMGMSPVMSGRTRLKHTSMHSKSVSSSATDSMGHAQW
mmetsp:Transcript_46017/g.143998  ORF Transcript_46017/g.143998 Transcript_46017/m.143998 type:complete len:204 (+) Transcript_46017:401-1012(+)